MEVDLVAHCGWTGAGPFVYTLTLVDVASGLVSCTGIRDKRAETVLAALRRLQRGLPFTILGLDSDSGSEFLNNTLLDYCADQHIIQSSAARISICSSASRSIHAVCRGWSSCAGRCCHHAASGMAVRQALPNSLAVAVARHDGHFGLPRVCIWLRDHTSVRGRHSNDWLDSTGGKLQLLGYGSVECATWPSDSVIGDFRVYDMGAVFQSYGHLDRITSHGSTESSLSLPARIHLRLGAALGQAPAPMLAQLETPFPVGLN